MPVRGIETVISTTNIKLLSSHYTWKSTAFLPQSYKLHPSFLLFIHPYAFTLRKTFGTSQALTIFKNRVCFGTFLSSSKWDVSFISTINHFASDPPFKLIHSTERYKKRIKTQVFLMTLILSSVTHSHIWHFILLLLMSLRQLCGTALLLRRLCWCWPGSGRGHTD